MTSLVAYATCVHAWFPSIVTIFRDIRSFSLHGGWCLPTGDCRKRLKMNAMKKGSEEPQKNILNPLWSASLYFVGRWGGESIVAFLRKNKETSGEGIGCQ